MIMDLLTSIKLILDLLTFICFKCNGFINVHLNNNGNIYIYVNCKVFNLKFILMVLDLNNIYLND